MSGLESLYQELILDHSKRPVGIRARRRRGAAPPPRTSATRSAATRSPSACRVDGDTVRDVTWEGAGCSISQASASMLAELVARPTECHGRGCRGPRHPLSSTASARRCARAARSTLDEDTFGDAAALSGVSKYTARVKCAMLAWVAFEDALGRA